MLFAFYIDSFSDFKIWSIENFQSWKSFYKKKINFIDNFLDKFMWLTTFSHKRKQKRPQRGREKEKDDAALYAMSFLTRKNIFHNDKII